MKSFKIKGLELKAMASALPGNVEYNNTFTDIYNKNEIDRICNMTGIFSRRTAHEGMTSIDLMYKAVKRLLEITQYDIKEIDCIICVTQTPAYNIPGNSYVLCNKLDAGNSIIALDINAGCPGFTHGLITMAKMLDGSSIKNGLLVVGDTFTQLISDRRDELVYGDGASACLVGFSEDRKETFVHWKIAAQKYNKIISLGANRPEEEIEIIKKAVGNNSHKALYMDGQEMFCFGIKELPQMISCNLSENMIKIDDIDLFLFHQSNKTMLEYIGNKMSIPKSKIPIFIDGIGSTSSASIPIALCRYAAENNITRLSGKLCFTGFGAGLSISTIIVDVEDMILKPLQIN